MFKVYRSRRLGGFTKRPEHVITADCLELRACDGDEEDVCGRVVGAGFEVGGSRMVFSILVGVGGDSCADDWIWGVEFGLFTSAERLRRSVPRLLWMM